MLAGEREEARLSQGPLFDVAECRPVYCDDCIYCNGEYTVTSTL